MATATRATLATIATIATATRATHYCHYHPGHARMTRDHSNGGFKSYDVDWDDYDG
ncbi:hypothetical protein B0T26DRAFT_755486 [Lasiosphaeria miniovina]|uniref:Uncharacterized protein n=1 Tax=Lasiosphaeria miniovina TaxID=1954250 RepID=A0AA40DJX9_9PEZI|nr:uncharacterized protein B0T26DRAFT_755486 [Lasiosphaeria miniovina]KAK0705920.1 hypothetical protein B0T26DRAFT_755486 [Lasiosphaeria miniovina]